MRSRLCGAFAQLTRWLTGVVVLGALGLVAGTPAPHASAPARVNVKDMQSRDVLPKTNLHTEFLVEINHLGQVARVRSGKSSPNGPFNIHSYGNALQAFIRTPDGRVIVGTYRLTYDYSVQTENVRRDVQLVKAGGVNPNAKGAASEMEEIASRHHAKPAPASPAPGVVPSVRLPDLPQVMKSSHP